MQTNLILQQETAMVEWALESLMLRVIFYQSKFSDKAHFHMLCL